MKSIQNAGWHKWVCETTTALARGIDVWSAIRPIFNCEFSFVTGCALSFVCQMDVSLLYVESGFSSDSGGRIGASYLMSISYPKSGCQCLSVYNSNLEFVTGKW